ncbi:AGE family epimerase/isomerase [Aerococcaceae bacterium zg-BR22]|uniref:AGE family epimerase/isomerase n=1 Tax=Aerococcaceae bacterium zg-1292 TaxID=2774330 RepID=UPI0040633727|nr:AGE family epimerase/isomerase [Aerococcaceae bacterium zg-BR22]
MNINQIILQLNNTIIPFWKNSIDSINEGFIGEVTYDLKHVTRANKSAVLQTRYLWAFSALYNSGLDFDAIYYADSAFKFIKNHMWDIRNEGINWSTTYNGKTIIGTKHIYSHSFLLYGVSEYYLAKKDPDILEFAKNIYYLIEKNFYQVDYNGYFEEFNSDWSNRTFTQVAANNQEYDYTSNSIIHLLEAYTNLYRIWPNTTLKKSINKILDNFNSYVIHSDGYCNTLFDKKWKCLTREISYAHDIETHWLLNKTLNFLPHLELQMKLNNIPTFILSNALDKNDLILMSNTPFNNNEWWAYAEAAIGFYNAYQITNNSNFKELSKKHWQFIQEHLVDSRKNSEWISHLSKDYKIIKSSISGPWKGPYHTVRMYIELYNRIHGSKPYQL